MTRSPNRGPRRPTAAVALAGALACVAAIVAPALPAGAAPTAGQLRSACYWVQGDVQNTFRCLPPAKTQSTLSISECWRYPPAEKTTVQRKTSEGWVNAGVGLRFRELKGCEKPFPWKTVVTIPAERMDSMKSFAIALYRMTMPASEGSYNGKPYSYGRTEITWGVCVVPEGTTEMCPSR